MFQQMTDIAIRNEAFPFTRQQYVDWLTEQDPDAEVCDLNPVLGVPTHCPIAYFCNYDHLQLSSAHAAPDSLRAMRDGRLYQWQNPPWVVAFIERIDNWRLERAGQTYHRFTANECLMILSTIPQS